MRLLVIPDIHENLDFLRYVMAAEDTARFDQVVLLGDYFDTRGELAMDDPLAHLRQVAETVVGFREILGDKLRLLCGNHDLPYYALRPACVEGAGRANRHIGGWMGCTTLERARVINAVWDEAFWKGLEGAVLLDGWLLSHAGVHPQWWPADAPDAETRYRRFRDEWQRSVEAIFDEPEPPIFAAGRAPGGKAAVGGPLWMDWNEEFEDALGLPQIVGHTRCPPQSQKGRSLCIDFAQAAYAVVEDGEVNLKVWPDSWLGKVMQEKGAEDG